MTGERINDMKKAIITLLLVISAFTLGAFSHKQNNVYANCGKIISVNYDTDTVVFEDLSGFQWGFKGVEDLFVGDIIAVVMDDNGTPIIFDDEIVDINYCGYEED